MYVFTTFRSDDAVIATIAPAEYVSGRQNWRAGHSADILFRIHSRVVIGISVSEKYYIMKTYGVNASAYCGKMVFNVILYTSRLM